MATSSKTLIQAADAMDTQTRTRIVHLPDIPGQVVQVRRIVFGLESFSSATAVVVVFHHNVELAVTLSVGDTTAAWARVEAGASGGTPVFQPVVFDPPYELVGPQRMDYQLSAGTGEGSVMVTYTLRRERNRTLWNELRSRTSFERG